MSRLITNAIRSTSASADAITFDNSGKPAFNGGAGKSHGFTSSFNTKKDVFIKTTLFAITSIQL